jgi:hypothetical protein
MDNEFTFNTGFNKQYPLAVNRNTSNSKTIAQMKDAEEHIKSHDGIGFYCSKRHEYIYIENTKIKNFQHINN